MDSFHEIYLYTIYTARVLIVGIRYNSHYRNESLINKRYDYISPN